jgi:hypothetical protein
MGARRIIIPFAGRIRRERADASAHMTFNNR